jgi:hypothetical protein
MKNKTMHMKKIIRILLVLAIVSLSTMVTMADPPGPPTGGNSNPSQSGGNPVGAPLDGGLSLLLIGLGAAYGGKKLFKSKEVTKD